MHLRTLAGTQGLVHEGLLGEVAEFFPRPRLAIVLVQILPHLLEEVAVGLSKGIGHGIGRPPVLVQARDHVVVGHLRQPVLNGL